MNGYAGVDAPWSIRYAPHLAIASVGYVLFGYAAVPDVVMTGLDVGFAEVGLLMSAALASFTLVQVVGGRLVNDRSTVRLLLGLSVVQGVLAVALDLAPTYYTLLAMRAAWGLAGGLVLTVGATHISRVYAGRAATQQEGIYGGMLALGGALAFLVTPPVVAATGWVGVHAVGSLLALPAIALLWRVRSIQVVTHHSRPAHGSRQTHEPQQAPGSQPADAAASDRDGSADGGVGHSPAGDDGSTADGSSHGGGSTTDRTGSGRRIHPIVLLAAWCYVATLGTYVTLSTFVTAYFADLGVVGPLNAFALLCVTVGRAGGGIVSGRGLIDDGRFLAVTTGLGAVGLTALALLTGPAVLVLPLFALLAVSLPFGAIYKVAATATARDASALAIVIAVGNLAALTLPAVTGAIRDATGGYEPAFLLLAVLNATAVAAGLRIARSRR